MPTKADLQEEVERLGALLAIARKEHEAFKERVVEKAVEVAAEQNWCDSGLRQTLDALDLELPTKRYRGEITLRFRFWGETDSQEVTQGWVENSVNFDNDGVNDVSFDSDWRDVTFEFVNANAEYVEVDD